MSHYGRAHTVSIEEDEDGFTITLEGVDEGDGIVRVNVQNVAEQLYDQVKARIGPWLRERDEAYAEFKARFSCSFEDIDESGGYDLSDPKHPRYHSVHADLWDMRERNPDEYEYLRAEAKRVAAGE